MKVLASNPECKKCDGDGREKKIILGQEPIYNNTGEWVGSKHVPIVTQCPCVRAVEIVAEYTSVWAEKAHYKIVEKPDNETPPDPA